MVHALESSSTESIDLESIAESGIRSLEGGGGGYDGISEVNNCTTEWTHQQCFACILRLAQPSAQMGTVKEPLWEWVGSNWKHLLSVGPKQCAPGV